MKNSTTVKSKKEIHDDKVKEIAARYREENYEVIIDPLNEQLPFDLAGYRPDLIAIKNNQGVIEGIIVEVTLNSSRSWHEKVQEAVEKVRKQSGWRFILVPADDSLPDALPDIDSVFLSWDSVRQRIDRADHLVELGEIDAAYLLLWIAFEHMMRLRAQEVLPLLDRFSSTILIRQLDDCDELSLEQYDVAMVCFATRNRVIHGVPLSNLAERFDSLRKLVQELMVTWFSLQAHAKLQLEPVN